MNKFKYSLLLCSLLSVSFSPSYLGAMKRQNPEEQQSNKTSWLSKLWPFKKRKTQEIDIQSVANMVVMPNAPIVTTAASVTNSIMPAQAEASALSSTTPPLVSTTTISSSSLLTSTSSTNSGTSLATAIDLEICPEATQSSPSVTSSVKTEDEKDTYLDVISDSESSLISTLAPGSTTTSSTSSIMQIPIDITQYLSPNAREKFQNLIKLLPANFQKTGEIISMILALFVEDLSAKYNFEMSKKIEQASSDIKKDIYDVRVDVAKQLEQLRQQLEASFSEAKEQCIKETIEQRELITSLHNNVSALRNKQKADAASVDSKLNELAKNQQELKNIQNSFGEKQSVQDSRIRRAIVVGTIALAGTTFVLYLPFVGGATFFNAITGGTVASLTSVGVSWIFYTIKDVLDSIKNVRNKISDCSIL